ncbi:hypothetical protein D3C85_1677120 [compost metagenome]
MPELVGGQGSLPTTIHDLSLLRQPSVLRVPLPAQRFVRILRVLVIAVEVRTVGHRAIEAEQ